jgi:uncharacterized phage protein (TIGR02218 family)
MRQLPPGLQAHLDSGSTTLCHCWRMTLKSGEKLGFTDHDLTLVFDATSFEAAAGFTASTIESALGLSVDNMEAEGALQSLRLDEARLKAGDFDHALVEVWRVNWQDVSQRVLLRKGHLGEVTFGDGAFRAEVRGLTHLMNQQRGRLYQFGCDAVLGDARCRVSLEQALFTRTGIVVSVEAAALIVSGIPFEDDWATRGRLSFLSGGGSGRTLAVKRQRQFGVNQRIDLAANIPFSVAAGDQVKLAAGCDKQFATCRTKFSNAINFRGFPHMPGTDFIMAVAETGDPANDGGKRL